MLIDLEASDGDEADGGIGDGVGDDIPPAGDAADIEADHAVVIPADGEEEEILDPAEHARLEACHA
jgi:hypothetical protein